MRTGADFVVMVAMLAVASGLVLGAYAWQRGSAPDPARVAGRVWADVADERFERCPRENGQNFWMGCTDLAPAGGKDVGR